MKVCLLLLSLILPTLAFSQSKALVHGQAMKLDKSTGKMLISGQVDGYDVKKEMRFQSDRLELLRDTKTDEISFAQVNGDVVVTQGLEYAVFDHGVYQRSLSLLTMKGHLILGNDQSRIEGDRAVYDTELEKVSLLPLPSQQLKFLFHQKNPDEPDNPTPITGVADEVWLFRELKKAILQGHVEVNDPTEPSQFKSGRVVVFFDSENQLDEMTASGGFHMTQPGRSSNSRRAVLNYNTRLITLLGNAKVQQIGEGEVQGERVEMHMDVKKGFIRGKRQKPIRIEIPLN